MQREALLGFSLPQPATIGWRFDQGAWQTLATRASALGVHIARLPPAPARAAHIEFRMPGEEGGPPAIYRLALTD